MNISFNNYNPKNRALGAFTLIELLVVIAIIAIAFAPFLDPFRIPVVLFLLF